MTGVYNSKNQGTAERAVSDFFEHEFLGIDLETQIRHCDLYELLSLFRCYLPSNQPILEAGSGSGRWVAWFMRNGFDAVGLDWSEALCSRAQDTIPGSRFELGDMRSMPFQNGQFGSIIALGSLEHVLEGPERALQEFYRVLRPNGVAIVTVPYGGILRKSLHVLFSPVSLLKSLWLLRRIFGKQGHKGTSLREAKRSTIRAWWPVFQCTKDGWHFHEYQFSKSQMRVFLRSAGFDIIEERVAFQNDGILFTFGRIAGRYDDVQGRPIFSNIGKLLAHVIPASYVGHMLCYVVQKADRRRRTTTST